MDNNEILSVLNMEKLVFEKINFQRKGFKNINSELNLQMNIRIGKTEGNDSSIVSLTILGDKADEYDFSVTVSGFFTVNDGSKIDENILLKQNAVAILMPYIRSQISLLTAQPETDCVVLPPFNIANMIPD